MSGGNADDIPARRINTDDFASRPEGAWLAQIAFALRTATDAQELAIGRPIDVINLVLVIFDLDGLFSNGGIF